MFPRKSDLFCFRACAFLVLTWILSVSSLYASPLITITSPSRNVSLAPNVATISIQRDECNVAFAIPYIQTNTTLNVAANVVGAGRVKFVLNEGQPNQAVIFDMDSPFTASFVGLAKGEYRLDAYIVDANQNVIAGVDNHDYATNIGIGDIYVEIGDSIAEGYDGTAYDVPPYTDWFVAPIVSSDHRNYPQCGAAAGFYRDHWQEASHHIDLNNKLSSYFGRPVFVLNEGVAGINSGGYVSRIGTSPWQNRMAALHPNKWLVHLGTNDGSGSSSFQNNMQSIINALKNTYGAAGADITLAIPQNGNNWQPYIDNLISTNSLTKGPDFLSFYARNPTLVSGVHPNVNGHAQMARLWALSIISPQNVAVQQSGQQVIVSWSDLKNIEPTIAGYKIYYGTNAANLNNVLDAGNILSKAIDIPGGQATYYFAVQGYDNDPTASITTALSNPISILVNPEIVPPTLTLNVSPTFLTAGQSSTLTWSSANTTSCTASNGWSGTKSTSGSQTISPTSTTMYALSCTGAGGMVNQSVTVAVFPASAVPFDQTNPVIYDNDGGLESGFTDEYIMALASAGVISLRGIISTGTNGEQPPYVPRTENDIIFERVDLVAKARRSGLRNIPDVSPGPGVSMTARRPASGIIEGTPPYGSKGGWLIVNEARKATPAKPLVVVMGGQGSALADAYLLDPSIADKVVAAWLVGSRRTSNGLLDAYEYNAYVDSWATYIIFERMRVVVFPVDSDIYASTPKSRLSELPNTEIRQLMIENRWPRSATTYSEPYGDWDGLGAIGITRPEFVYSTKQVSFSHWEPDRWGGANQIPVWKEDPNGRTMVVWGANTAIATQEWWLRMKDPAAWGASQGQVPLNGTPGVVPGIIEAENFDHGGTNVSYVDTTNNWTKEIWFTPIRFLDHVDIQFSAGASGGYKVWSTEAGEWIEYTVAVANADIYNLEIAVASSGAGGIFHVELDGVDKTGPLSVPNTGGSNSWQIISKPGITLSPGTHIMRLVMDSNGANNQVGDFDYFRLTDSLTTSSPVFNPTEPTFTGSVNVSLSSATSGAEIRYTIDGSPPTATSTLYTGPITVSSSTTIKAIARLSGKTDSFVVTASYTKSTPQPVFSLNVSSTSVNVGGALSVSWTAPAGQTFAKDWISLYRVGDPNTAYKQWVYTNGATSGTFNTTAPLTSGTYEFRYLRNDGYTDVVRSAQVTVTTLNLVATPSFSPAGGSYTSAQNVSLSSATSGAEIRYTIDGSPPTATSTLYTGPITVSSSTTIKAIARQSGLTDSAVATATYIIGQASLFTLNVSSTLVNVGGALSVSWTAPAGQTFAKDWISLYRVGDPNTAYKQWVYTNGATSGTFNTTAPLTSGTYEFRYLRNDGYTDVVRSAQVTVTIPNLVATPSFSPAGGSYTSAQNVSLSSATSGAEIRYTIDGSTPTTSSTLYVGPITVSNTTTIKAIARLSGLTDSAVATATYIIGQASLFTLNVSSTLVNVGGALSVSWTAPAGQTFAKDWISLYRVGDPNTAYKQWVYTNGATSGTFNTTAPLTSGTYEFRYLRNDGYTDVVRSVPVTVN